MRNTPFLAVIVGAALLPLAHAATLSVNFTHSTAVDELAASDQAGLNYDYGGLTTAQTYVTNWNDVAAAATGSVAAGTLKYDDGSTASGVSFAWTGAAAQGALAATSPTVTPNDRMMKGFLDVTNSTIPAQLTVSGLTFAGNYSVIIYFDGPNATAARTSSYSIGGATVTGEDSENTSWGTGQNTLGIFQHPVAGGSINTTYDTDLSPNNNEGNFVVISGVSGSSFTLSAIGTAGAVLRAPINGFQIVSSATPAPEPSVAMLGGLGALALLRRRRN